MLRLIVDAERPDRELVARAAALIREGSVVACPTDTLYALAADATNPKGVAQVFRLKGRDAAKALPIVAADCAQVAALVGDMSALARRLAETFWPGPLSLVIPALSSIVPDVHGGVGTVAVRVPAHAVTRLLIELAGAPLTATSANRAGQPAARTADDVARAFGRSLPVLLDAGPASAFEPSTIVDVTGERPRLVRAGAIPFERVLESLQ